MNEVQVALLAGTTIGFSSAIIICLIWGGFFRDETMERAQQERGDYWFSRFQEVLKLYSEKTDNPWKREE